MTPVKRKGFLWLPYASVVSSRAAYSAWLSFQVSVHAQHQALVLSCFFQAKEYATQRCSKRCAYSSSCCSREKLSTFGFIGKPWTMTEVRRKKRLSKRRQTLSKSVYKKRHNDSGDRGKAAYQEAVEKPVRAVEPSTQRHAQEVLPCPMTCLVQVELV